ncbi:MAG TPA: hypothetical protein DEP87_01320 [Candidatus Pacebacteria bacterium]|nr:hypothetical protein [Candidatus Paceibacterota bacterium]
MVTQSAAFESQPTDKAEKAVLYGPVPDIGAGNVNTQKSTFAELELNEATTKTPINWENLLDLLNNPLVWAANLVHQRMSHQASLSVKYSETSVKARNSLAGKILCSVIRLQIFAKILELQAKGTKRLAILTPQDMTAEAATWLLQHQQLLKTFGLLVPEFIGLTYPDTLGKFDPQKSANALLHHFVWTLEIYLKLLEAGIPESQIHLVDPNILSLAYDQPETLAPHTGTLIKLSGSGGDPALVTALTASLTQNGHAPTLVTDNAWFYHTLAEADPQNPPNFIAYPSEQVMHLCQLQQKGLFIPTVFLYPRGENEVNNLVNAIKNFHLTKVVCVPQALQERVAILLEKHDLHRREYTMVDPSELKPEHFQKPEKVWNAPKTAEALSGAINRVIRQSLEGSLEKKAKGEDR